MDDLTKQQRESEDQVAREIHDMQMVVGRLLQVGVSIAAIVVLIGAAVYLSRHAGETVSYFKFEKEPADLRHIPGILDSTFASGRNIIQFGLLLLIATPVARVAFSIFTFLKEKDRLYGLFTAIVLGLLMYSLLATK